MKKMKWKVVGTGLVASVLLSSSMAFANEAPQNKTYSSDITKIQKTDHMRLGNMRGMFKEWDTKYQDMTPEQKQELHLTHLKERLDQEVADGKITQDKADEMYEKATNGKFLRGMGRGIKECKLGERSEEFKNMTPEQKQEMFLTHLKECLDEEVANGKITQDKADEMYEKATNSEFPKDMKKGMKRVHTRD